MLGRFEIYSLYEIIKPLCKFFFICALLPPQITWSIEHIHKFIPHTKEGQKVWKFINLFYFFKMLLFALIFLNIEQNVLYFLNFFIFFINILFFRFNNTLKRGVRHSVTFKLSGLLWWQYKLWTRWWYWERVARFCH